MDQRIHDIEWYTFFTAPRHTAFKKNKSIGLFHPSRIREPEDKKEKPPPGAGWNAIGLLNVFIWKAADFVSIRYKVCGFFYFKLLLNCCRGPPIQEFYSKNS